MNAFQTYVTYCALKRHFSSDTYDYFKYNGKLRLKPESFVKRPDKYYFEKISSRLKNEDIMMFLVSNIVQAPTEYWIRNYDGAYETFLKWRSKVEAMEYHFKEECTALLKTAKLEECSFNKIFEVNNGSHPKILAYYITQKISIETLIILNKLLKFSTTYDRCLSHHPIWQTTSFMIKKYSPFLQVEDNSRYAKILISLTKEIYDS